MNKVEISPKVWEIFRPVGYWQNVFGNSEFLHSEGYFLSGKKEGPWRYYWPPDLCEKKTGTLFSKGDYENGKMNGHWYYYYNDGKVLMEGRIKDNHRVGIWMFNHEDGSQSTKTY